MAVRRRAMEYRPEQVWGTLPVIPCRGLGRSRRRGSCRPRMSAQVVRGRLVVAGWSSRHRRVAEGL